MSNEDNETNNEVFERFIVMGVDTKSKGKNYKYILQINISTEKNAYNKQLNNLLCLIILHIRFYICADRK